VLRPIHIKNTEAIKIDNTKEEIFLPLLLPVANLLIATIIRKTAMEKRKARIPPRDKEKSSARIIITIANTSNKLAKR
jgi:hypothetical protein